MQSAVQKRRQLRGVFDKAGLAFGVGDNDDLRAVFGELGLKEEVAAAKHIGLRKQLHKHRAGGAVIIDGGIANIGELPQEAEGVREHPEWLRDTSSAPF